MSIHGQILPLFNWLQESCSLRAGTRFGVSRIKVCWQLRRNLRAGRTGEENGTQFSGSQIPAQLPGYSRRENLEKVSLPADNTG